MPISNKETKVVLNCMNYGDFTPAGPSLAIKTLEIALCKLAHKTSDLCNQD